MRKITSKKMTWAEVMVKDPEQFKSGEIGGDRRLVLRQRKTSPKQGKERRARQQGTLKV